MRYMQEAMEFKGPGMRKAIIIKKDPNKPPMTLIERFEKSMVYNTIWASESTMRELGIKKEISTLLMRMGLPGLENFHYPTYLEPTREFFSTLNLVEEKGKNSSINGCMAYFHLGGKVYTFTCEDLCVAFGFPNDPERHWRDNRSIDELWTLVTGATWNGDFDKITNIKNPVIRYVAKLVSNTLLGGVRSRRVNYDDMSLLYRGLCRHVDDYETGIEAVNNGYLFLKGILGYRERERNVMRTSTLNFGGMLTPLFIRLGIDLRGYTLAGHEQEMDLEYLALLRFCKPNPRDGYYHIWHADGTPLICRLPKIRYTSLISTRNISFLIPEEEICVPDAPKEDHAKELMRIDTRPESSGYSSSSNDEAMPEDLFLDMDDLPTPPGTPTTPEALEWAQYSATSLQLFERKISSIEKVAEWKQKVKAKGRRRRKKISDKIFKAKSKQESQGEIIKKPNNLTRARRMNNVNKVIDTGESVKNYSESS